MGYKILSNIGVALGNKKVNNEYYLEQMDASRREKARHFYQDVLGRNIRHLVEEDQTSLSLAIDAAKKAVAANEVDVNDIDMVICISYTPEYVSPSMARMIVEALGGKETTNCFDMNSNCTAMLQALDIADRFFKTDEKMKNILIVQGDCNSRLNIENTSPFFGVLSDIGCAIILQKDDQSGILSSYLFLSNKEANNIVYPKDGYSKPNPVLYVEPDTDPGVEAMASRIKEIYGEEKMKAIKLFCISQFAYINWKRYVMTAEVDADKVPYVGDLYGYTGPSSPILALKKGIDEGKIARGDTILFWTYGAGYLHSIIEMKY